MLGHLPEVNRAIKGIGFLVGDQKPFVRFLIQNWPLAAIAGFAMFAKGRERYKNGDLTVYNVLADAGLVLSPLVGLALINQLAKNQEIMQQPVQVQAPQQSTLTQAINAMQQG